MLNVFSLLIHNYKIKQEIQQNVINFSSFWCNVLTAAALRLFRSLEFVVYLWVLLLIYTERISLPTFYNRISWSRSLDTLGPMQSRKFLLRKDPRSNGNQPLTMASLISCASTDFTHMTTGALETRIRVCQQLRRSLRLQYSWTCWKPLLHLLPETKRKTWNHQRTLVEIRFFLWNT